MRHRPNQLPVLDDRTAAHALNDTAGACNQAFIRHPQHHPLGGRLVLPETAENLHRVLLRLAAVHRGKDGRLAGMHRAACAHRKPLRVEGRSRHLAQRAVYAVRTVDLKRADLMPRLEKAALELAGLAGLPAGHANDRRAQQRPVLLWE